MERNLNYLDVINTNSSTSFFNDLIDKENSKVVGGKTNGTDTLDGAGRELSKFSILQKRDIL